MSREELLIGFSETMGELAEAEVDRIMEVADTDGSGEIDYSGMQNYYNFFKNGWLLQSTRINC